MYPLHKAVMRAVEFAVASTAHFNVYQRDDGRVHRVVNKCCLIKEGKVQLDGCWIYSAAFFFQAVAHFSWIFRTTHSLDCYYQ